MKNIHILPTDKPSRLRITSKDKLILSTIPVGSKGETQNIYITSDEEIKEGDWTLMFDDFGNLFLSNEPQQYLGIEKGHHLNKGLRKIILTTDQQLIDDGVQAIDDEFLEWFVKNSSCEFVEVIPLRKSSGHYDDKEVWHWDFLAYKIIIPKEEPKQETILEAAERLFTKERYPKSFETLRKTFISNAKWQQQRSYSEEDMKASWNDGSNQYSGIGDAETYFEQLKNK